jgi:hypothetical protein
MAQLNPIIEKLIRNFQNYYWYGYFRVLGRSNYKLKYQGKHDEYPRTHFISLKTYTPQSIIKIKLTLFFKAPWEIELTDFSFKKYDYAIKIEIEDELRRFSKKEIYYDEHRKGEKDTAYLKKLFEKIMGVANFPEVEKKEIMADEIKTIISSL